MGFGLVLLKSEVVAILVDVLENVMILMTFEPPLFPIEGHRAVLSLRVGEGFGLVGMVDGAAGLTLAHNKKMRTAINTTLMFYFLQ